MKPKLHFTAPYHWINDPNGLIYYKGNYHIFYQHFPYDNKWGTMHWGHAITKDFVNFEHLPIALYPSKILIEMDVFQDQQLKLMANFIFIIQLLNTLKKIQVMYTINIVMMI